MHTEPIFIEHSGGRSLLAGTVSSCAEGGGRREMSRRNPDSRCRGSILDTVHGEPSRRAVGETVQSKSRDRVRSRTAPNAVTRRDGGGSQEVVGVSPSDES